MNKLLRRALIYVPLLVLAAAVAAPFIGAERFRAPIQRELERALGRPVEIRGEIHFKLLPRPGFSVGEVVIHELAAHGVEPFAYVALMDVSVSLASLLRGEVGVAAIRMVEPHINLMKQPGGGWNFQPFLEHALGQAQGRRGALPGIVVAAGRLNFKHGDTKSVFYLDATDLALDADSSNPDRFGIRIEGEPARTDRATRAFGRLSGRGMITLDANSGADSRLELSLALERMSVSELMTLLEGRSIGLGGLLTTRARLSGPLSNIAIEGRMELEGFERFRWLLARSGGWGVDFQGSLNLTGQEMAIETLAPPKSELPVSVRLHAANLWSRARWAALITLRDAPLASLHSLAADLGVGLGRDWPMEGKVRGALGFSEAAGAQGELKFERASIEAPELGPVRFETANLVVKGREFTLRPATVTLQGGQSLTVEGTINAETGARDVSLQTESLGLSEFQAAWKLFLGGGVSPVLDHCRLGTWSGALRYRQKEGEAAPGWTGGFEVASTECRVEGLPRALQIASAKATLKGSSVALRDVTGNHGEVAFQAGYSFDTLRRRPHRLRIAIEEAKAADFEELLAPAFQRSRGLIARTLRRAAPEPEWLRARRLDGTVEIGRLAAGEFILSGVKSRLYWDGARLEFADARATTEGGTLHGRVAVDLAGPEPAYQAHLEVQNAAWRQGKLDATAEIATMGMGERFLANLNIEGAFHSRDVTFDGDSPWRAFSGCFLYAPNRLGLTGLQAAGDGDSFQGEGSAGAEGRLTVELSSPRRQLRINGRLAGLRLEFGK